MARIPLSLELATQGFKETWTRTSSMTTAEALRAVSELLAEHYLTGWKVSFGSAKRTAGTCNHRMKVITLSKYLLAQRSYEDSLNTISHEVAHALTPGHSHDAVWARQHRAMGGDGQRCFQHMDEQSPWVGRCERCPKEYPRYRAPKRLDGWRCRCNGRSPVVWSRRDAA